jgi:hypothetical protein
MHYLANLSLIGNPKWGFGVYVSVPVEVQRALGGVKRGDVLYWSLEDGKAVMRKGKP